MKYQQLPRKYVIRKLAGKRIPERGHEMAGRSFSQLKHHIFKMAYLRCFPDADPSEINMNFSIYEELPAAQQPEYLISLIQRTATRIRRPMRVDCVLMDVYRPNTTLSAE